MIGITDALFIIVHAFACRGSGPVSQCTTLSCHTGVQSWAMVASVALCVYFDDFSNTGEAVSTI